MTSSIPHQYIDRRTGCVRTEKLYCDWIVNFVYQNTHEKSPRLFELLTSNCMTALLGFLTFDLAPSTKLKGINRMIESLGIDLAECVDPPAQLNSLRKVFERKINYWKFRPMPDDVATVVSPADAKMLAGSFSETSSLFIKEKFFNFEELIGIDKPRWRNAFCRGSFAIFRLTPDKYHYNHTPVAGKVVDIYEIHGGCHSCNPGAVVTAVSPYSKNRRVVTIINTDVAGGTQVGLVAMIEIVALMIGDIVQCYSDERYDTPQTIRPGMFLRKGNPKSLYRPGSSVDVVIFQENRIEFSRDIVINMFHNRVISRFSKGFGRSLVETEVTVRSEIASRSSYD